MTGEDLSTSVPERSRSGNPRVGVDLVLMTIIDGALAALLTHLDGQRFEDKWALPGGFVGPDEALNAAADRVLREKARIHDAYVEQLYTFGAIARDPRLRAITVAYFALLPAGRFIEAINGDPQSVLARLGVPWRGETGGPVHAIGPSGALSLAFDHAEIVGTAVQRLRGKLDYSPVGFALLPERFTLRQLQEVHEAILGRPMGKPAFRRRMLDKGWLEATGDREAGAAFRPAELYRFRRTR